MANSHAIPDMFKEVQSICADLLPATVLSTTWPTVPVPPGMTLAAFATRGYVRDGPDLVYVDQPAQAVTLTGADGNYWLALTVDSFTDYAQWQRVYGGHYAWRPNSTQPADVDGLLVAMQLTVAGGAITAVTPIASRATLAAAWRGLLALGTMATQNANAVAITGGDVVATRVGVNQSIAADANGTLRVGASAVVQGNLSVQGTGANYMAGALGVQTPAITSPTTAALTYAFNGGTWGILGHANAPGNQSQVVFQNASAVTVGSINSTDSATSYNTSSDVRLKHAVVTMTDALLKVLALRPVTFKWNSDDSPGEGFLAHELQHIIPLAVTGEPDELNADGSIKPQQVDHSKLVPWLVGAIKELSAQVTTLTTRITELETALGV